MNNKVLSAIAAGFAGTLVMSLLMIIKKVTGVMPDFHGWTAGAFQEDLKFDFKHRKDIERLAIVGESKWEADMSLFCTMFTVAKIQYVDFEKLDEAHAWPAGN